MIFSYILQKKYQGYDSLFVHGPLYACPKLSWSKAVHVGKIGTYLGSSYRQNWNIP